MITQKYLKSVLSYNPKTGLFRWLISKKGVSIGRIVGFKNYKGYSLIHLDGKVYRAHRLAWLYMTGKWPKNQVDHENNIKDDNRWKNLREADNQSNHYNLLRPKNNTSGAKGVRKVKGGYQARIKYNQKEIYLGVHPTLEIASDVYLAKAKELANEYANRGHN